MQKPKPARGDVWLIPMRFDDRRVTNSPGGLGRIAPGTEKPKWVIPLTAPTRGQVTILLGNSLDDPTRQRKAGKIRSGFTVVFEAGTAPGFHNATFFDGHDVFRINEWRFMEGARRIGHVQTMDEMRAVDEAVVLGLGLGDYSRWAS